MKTSPFIFNLYVCEGVMYNLSDNSSISRGLFCPGDRIRFTCKGIGVPVVLEWYINGSIVADYRFRSSYTFPWSADSTTDHNVTVTISEVIGLSVTAIKITSTLAGHFNDLYRFSFECGSDTILSNLIMVTDFGNF